MTDSFAAVLAPLVGWKSENLLAAQTWRSETSLGSLSIQDFTQWCITFCEKCYFMPEVMFYSS